MSCIIRAVKGPWLAPPKDSDDVAVRMPTSTYGLAQLAIEAAERLNQSQVNRTIRAGRMAAPLPSATVRPVPVPSSSSFILNMPIN